MKTLIVFVSLAALAYASGGHGGAVVKGPSGVVTSHGAIGPNGLPNGAVTAALGHAGLGLGLGLGHGAVVAAPVGVVPGAWGAGAWGAGLGAGLGAGAWGVGPALGVAHIGHGVVTNGGGSIALSGHGVTVHGPPTAPAVIAGPSGKVAADGLWGPTATWATGGHGGVYGVGHGGHW